MGGSEATETLSLLSDDTRLEIIEALATQRRDTPFSPEMSFSALADEVGISDTGRFNYHLDKLRGSFIEKTDEGYTLNVAGHTIVAAVLGVSVETRSQYEKTLRDECHVCETPVTVERNGDFVSVTCENGHGFAEMLPPRLETNVDISTAAELAAVRAVGNIRQARRGLCPRCAGQIEWSLTRDETGEVDPYDSSISMLGLCQTCGMLYAGSPEGFVFFESPVIARLRELGFDVWADPVQWWIRGEGGTIESFDESSGTVEARFEFSAFSMTATVRRPFELAEFSIDPHQTADTS